MKRIILTGGGSAGHVTANLALLPSLMNNGWEVHYIGTENGIENSIVSKDKVTYHSIRTGKLRRYFDFRNFIDPFNVIIGIIQSYIILRKLKPSIVFAKGGFVSLPVIVSSWALGIPAITHEGDVSLGLANKLSLPFIRKICVSFEETLQYVGRKGVYTGLPVRKEILGGNVDKGFQICDFEQDKPIILVMGGSQGSRNINRLLRESLVDILPHFNVIHICGKGNIDMTFDHRGYRQFEYLTDELPHVFAVSDITISRSGTASVFEILALKKPAIFIPLTTNASRGEQLLNAGSFERNGLSKVLQEHEITKQRLYEEILDLYKNRDVYIGNMKKYQIPNSIDEIMKLICEIAE